LTPEKDPTKEACAPDEDTPPPKKLKIDGPLTGAAAGAVSQSSGSSEPCSSKASIGGARENSSVSMCSADRIPRTHKLIDLAKNGSWDELYKSLDSQRDLVNMRPEVREYSVLHQAAFLGAKEALNILIDKFDADPMLPTKSGELITDIAKKQGHFKLAEGLALRLAAVARPIFGDDSGLTPKKAPTKEVRLASKRAPISKKLKVDERTPGVVGHAKPAGSGSSDPPPSSEASIAVGGDVGSAAMPSADLIPRAHKLIDLAKNSSWDELYKALDSQRDLDLVNIRPEVREYSVLHQAAFLGAEDALNILIDKYGADPLLPTKSGELIVDIARQQGHAQVAKKLAARLKPRDAAVSSGPLCPPTPKRPAELVKLTPSIAREAHKLLDLAKDGEWDKVFKAMDARPELVNARPSVREYAVLHQAVYHGNEEVVRTLLYNYGADPALCTKSGHSAIDVAKGQGRGQIAIVLSSHMEGGASASAKADGGAEVEEGDDGDADFDFIQMKDGSWKVVPK